VEAVAWISQLKTSGALALSLGALLAHRRRPGVAALLFALALLTKVSAVFALPMAAAFTWARRGGPGGGARHWAWLGVWALIFGVCAIPQFASFEHLGGVDVPAFSDRWVHLWTIAAIGARYLLMAATSYGVSAFQEPAPVTSPFDPWWLAALPAGTLLAWRALATLRRRSEEAAWWVGAAASFALVSQLRPFLHPIADRYLYFILPGLIGGVVLWAVEARERLAGVIGSGRFSAALGRGTAVGVGALVVLFALHSADRAKLWRSEILLLVDAASNYPEGGTAYFLRARRAAQEGDVEGAVAALRAAADRGIDRFMVLPEDPGLAPIRNAPAFRDVVREMAGQWIERARERGHSTQPELRVMAQAHLVREEYAEAVGLLERALRAGGPLDSVVRSELAAARAARAAQVRRRGEAGAEEEDPDRAQTR
jgi:tetratricopeptide (TPR) repeat protein